MIKTKLHIEIEDELDELSKMEVGTDQHKIAVDELTRLMDRAIELEKVENDAEDKKETRENENTLRLKQMEDEKKDRLIKNCLTGASIISGIGVTIWGALKSWKFEETGTVTSTAGRKFISNLFSRK